MSKPKFTQGPWRVDSERNVQGQKYYSVSFGDNDGQICDFIDFKEDAALIAAAPELYAALERICKACCDDSAACPCCNIRKVLAKARGESEDERQ